MGRQEDNKGTGKSTLHEKGTNDEDSKPPQDHNSTRSGDSSPTHPERNTITVKEEIEAADAKEGGDTGSANGVDVVNKFRDKGTGQAGNTGDSGKVPSVKAIDPGTAEGGGEDTGIQGSKTRSPTREDDTTQTTGPDSDCRIESTRPTDTAVKFDEGRASGTVMNAAAVVGKSEAVGESLEDREVGTEGKRLEEEESSDEDDGDGFRIVVGREATPSTAGPSAPTKRFLPGTNTLVNASINSGAGSTDSRSTSSSKPVSAAAGIASLVPSTGTPTTTRPALKPGEYPPTAELQQSNGKTAFDVDIDGLEEQPWRHPGVDIADFFNYGFTEESWRVYCEKQLRNRYDQTAGRAQKKPGSGRGDANSLARYVGAAGARRGVDQRHGDLHNSGPGRPNFAAQGPPGSGWGSGSARERYVHGFGNGPPSESGRGTVSPTWFDGPPQLHPGNRANFSPGPAGIGQDRAGGGVRGAESSGAVRRSLSPDPRGNPNGKMHRIR